MTPPNATASHLHEPFLRRAADVESTAASGLALGGFLTMRLVDGFTSDQLHLSPDGLAYQLRATSDYLDDLLPPCPEVHHLRDIGRVAQAAFDQQAPWLLTPPLLAYAFWLEQELRWDESLDVLEATLRVGDDGDSGERVAAYLQTGRMLRYKGRWDDARYHYAMGGDMAARLGDRHSELVSRLGRATVQYKTGDLKRAETELRDVLATAQSFGERDAEARACHDLSVVLSYAGRTVEAIPLAFRAFELYEQPAQRVRALSDTGMHLKTLGYYSAARDALLVAIETATPLDVRYRALVELLDLSGLIEDRVTFERARRELQPNYSRLPFDEKVEYKLKLGSGLSAFERYEEGAALITEAIELAERHRLGEMRVRAEQTLNDLRERRAAKHAAPPQRSVPVPELLPTIERLQTLRASA